jgi:hypothetical protein
VVSYDRGRAVPAASEYAAQIARRVPFAGELREFREVAGGLHSIPGCLQIRDDVAGVPLRRSRSSKRAETNQQTSSGCGGLLDGTEFHRLSQLEIVV